MKKLAKSEFFKLLLAVLFISSGVWILNFVSAGKLMNSMLNLFVSPIQYISNKVASVSTESLRKRKSEAEFEEKIRQLNEELRRLRTIVADYREVKRENVQFLKFYGIKKQDPSLEFKVATVTSRSPADVFGGFTINMGYKGGAFKNATVMTDSGVVGRIEEVNSENSRVVTIFSPEFKASVVDVDTGDGGILSGNCKLFNDGFAGVFYLPAQNSVKPDDIIVTTGMGGIFPKNMPIGKVKELRQDDFDSSFYAVVEPFSNVKSITEVYVVTNFAGKEQ